MATNLNSLAVDFTPYDINFTENIDTTILSQFYKSSVLKQVIGAFAAEAQELYDAITDMRKRRCILYADGINLEAIGRIVGQDKVQYTYDDSMYFIPDTENQSCDQGIAYVQNAPLADVLEPDDNTYRTQILGRIQNNMNRFSSVPEFISQASISLGIPVSVDIIAPAKVNIVVTDAASATDQYMLTLKRNSVTTEDSYYFPYPAGINISGIVVRNP